MCDCVDQPGTKRATALFSTFSYLQHDVSTNPLLLFKDSLAEGENRNTFQSMISSMYECQYIVYKNTCKLNFR